MLKIKLRVPVYSGHIGYYSHKFLKFLQFTLFHKPRNENKYYKYFISNDSANENIRI
jgi:hypothetical protein